MAKRMKKKDRARIKDALYLRLQDIQEHVTYTENMLRFYKSGETKKYYGSLHDYYAKEERAILDLIKRS